MITPLYLVQHMPSNNFTFLGGSPTEAYESLLESAFMAFPFTNEAPRPIDIYSPFGLHFESGAFYRLRGLSGRGNLIAPGAPAEFSLLSPYAMEFLTLYQNQRLQVGAGLYWEKLHTDRLAIPGIGQKKVLRTFYKGWTVILSKIPGAPCKITMSNGVGKIERERPEIEDGFQLVFDILEINGAGHE